MTDKAEVFVQDNVKGGNLCFWSPWSKKIRLRVSFNGQEMILEALAWLKHNINVPF